MATAHNSASIEEISNVVIMPGDPLRAKYIAEKYLENVIVFNTVRNMNGYTGVYKGKRISIMGSGMGIGSMGIYSHELFNKYNVDVILRVGSCGAYTLGLSLLDVFLVESSWSESTYAKTYSGYNHDVALPSSEVNEHIKKMAKLHKIAIKTGRIHTSDCFYYKQKEDLNNLTEDKKCYGVDMESFSLFYNAMLANKKAASVLTVSDHSITKERATTEQREKSFDKMIELALNSILEYAS